MMQIKTFTYCLDLALSNKYLKVKIFNEKVEILLDFY